MDFAVMSDSQLVSSYLSGNEDSLAFLIKKHRQRLFSYIIVRIQDEDAANDVFQDTFVKAIQTLKRGKYNEEGKFLNWIMRIAHNLIIDHFRRNKRMPTISPTDEFNIFDIISGDELNIEERTVKSQIEADLLRLIEELPEEQKEVLKLRHYAELSFKEIAEQTGVSINTALGRMRYALINIRRLAEKHQVSLKA
jgi:RNA polymerase sigma-70 factor (ECF subfamily)